MSYDSDAQQGWWDSMTPEQREAYEDDIVRRRLARTPPRRQHTEYRGTCLTCDENYGQICPPHDPSPRCESGAHAHCSCDTCF